MPAGYVIKSIPKIENYLVIFAHYNNTNSGYLNKADAYFWNYLDLDPTKVIDLKDNRVCTSFQYKTTIGCITAGTYRAGNTGSKPYRLKLWDGSSFKVVANFGGEEPVGPGAVQVIEDAILINAGIIYQWGSDYPLIPNQGLHQIGQGSGTTSGILKEVGTSTLICSTGSTTSGGLELLDPNKYISGSILLSYASPRFKKGTRGEVTNVRVEFQKKITTSAMQFQLGIQTEQLSLQSVATAADNIVSASTETMVKEWNKLQDGTSFPVFTKLAPKLIWESSTPSSTECLGVTSVEIDFVFVNYTVV